MEKRQKPEFREYITKLDGETLEPPLEVTSQPMDPEIKAMYAIKRALAPLDHETIKRVVRWVTDRFEKAAESKKGDEGGANKSEQTMNLEPDHFCGIDRTRRWDSEREESNKKAQDMRERVMAREQQSGGRKHTTKRERAKRLAVIQTKIYSATEDALALIEAVPGASEEQILRATAMLQGRFTCGECATSHAGEEEPCPCHFDHPASPACGFWTAPKGGDESE